MTIIIGARSPESGAWSFLPQSCRSILSSPCQKYETVRQQEPNGPPFPPSARYLTAAVGSRSERHAPAFLSVGPASSRGPAGHATVPLSADCRRCIRSGCWNLLLIWTSSLDFHRPGTWVEIVAGSCKAQGAAARPIHETGLAGNAGWNATSATWVRRRGRVRGPSETKKLGNLCKQTKYGQTEHTFRSVLKTKKRDTLALTSVDSPADPFRDLPNPSPTWPHQISTCITLRRPTLSTRRSAHPPETTTVCTKNKRCGLQHHVGRAKSPGHTPRYDTPRTAPEIDGLTDGREDRLTSHHSGQQKAAAEGAQSKALQSPLLWP